MTKTPLEALKACADQFAFYAEEHRKAGKIEKAETNERFRDMARQALTGAGEPVFWQWRHYNPITGKPYWDQCQYRNGNRSEISRPLYTSPQTPTPDPDTVPVRREDLRYALRNWVTLNEDDEDDVAVSDRLFQALQVKP